MNFELRENEFLAIKVSQPFGEYYTLKLNAKYLLERSYSKSASYDGADFSGSQRKIKRTRLSEIGQFIDSDEALFPNSIIIAANYDEKDLLVDEDLRWKVDEIDESLGIYKLTIPTKAKVSSIVDGQHRLYGFEYSSRADMELTCSVYLDLPPSFQASVFATVNFNQSPVDKSLAYNLFGYQLDHLNSKDWSPDLLAVNLCRYFAESTDEFFYKHINYRLHKRNVPPKFWVISTASFVDGVLSLISNNPKDDRYSVNKRSAFGVVGRKALKVDSLYPLRNLYIQGNDEAIRQIISGYFSAVRETFEIEDVSDSVLVKTIGVSALFSLLNEILLINADRINNELIESFQVLLCNAKDIDFNNTDFYAPSSKGKLRLLNMLKFKVLNIKFENMGLRSDAIMDLNDELSRVASKLVQS